jgi:hypothetical protein
VTKYRLFRGVDDPNEVFVSLEFPSMEEAKSFRERLLASGALNNVTIEKEPTLAELVEEVTY